jgi:hypothetical protein
VVAEFIEDMNGIGVFDEFILTGYFSPCSTNTVFCPGLLLKFVLSMFEVCVAEIFFLPII